MLLVILFCYHIKQQNLIKSQSNTFKLLFAGISVAKWFECLRYALPKTFSECASDEEIFQLQGFLRPLPRSKVSFQPELNTIFEFF